MRRMTGKEEGRKILELYLSKQMDKDAERMRELKEKRGRF